MCSNFFTVNDGFVVCHQLGFPGIDKVVNSQVFGSGSGNIVLGNVNCSGSEDKITDCQFNGIGSHNCDKSKAVGIKCSKLLNY